jgi:hypothetical protein
MFALEFQPGGVQRLAHRHTIYFETRPKVLQDILWQKKRRKKRLQKQKNRLCKRYGNWEKAF